MMLVLLVLSLFSVPVQAAKPENPVCVTLSECDTLKAGVSELVQKFIDDSTVGVGSVLRNAYGHPRKLTYVEAQQACSSLGSRLPTAREFADYAVLLGAKGVKDTAYPGVNVREPAVAAEMNAMRRLGFNVEFTVNANGEKLVDFYMDHSGFQYQDRELHALNIWTATETPDSSAGGKLMVVTFASGSGYFVPLSRDDQNGDRRFASFCMKPPTKATVAQGSGASSPAPCDSLSSCIQLGNAIDDRRHALRIDAAGFGPALVDATGELVELTYAVARDYCASLGSRLPTDLDWIFGYATASNGRAKATQFPGIDATDPRVAAEIVAMHQQGYKAVVRRMADRTPVVHFYYDDQDYIDFTLRDHKETESGFYWSSTLDEENPNYAYAYGHWMGDLHPWSLFGDTASVRCMKP